MASAFPDRRPPAAGPKRANMKQNRFPGIGYFPELDPGIFNSRSHNSRKRGRVVVFLQHIWRCWRITEGAEIHEIPVPSGWAEALFLLSPHGMQLAFLILLDNFKYFQLNFTLTLSAGH
jgi:hypothetical protein